MPRFFVVGENDLLCPLGRISPWPLLCYPRAGSPPSLLDNKTLLAILNHLESLLVHTLILLGLDFNLGVRHGIIRPPPTVLDWSIVCKDLAPRQCARVYPVGYLGLLEV